MRSHSVVRKSIIAGAIVLVLFGAIGIAWAAPTIPAGSTPPASHQADGRAQRACTTCHTVTQPTTPPGPTPLGDRKAVPRIVGLSGKYAVAVLKKTGFTVWVSHAYSKTVPRYRIISQTPVAGSSLRTGRTVTIVESLGKPATVSAVPSCVRCHGRVPSGTKPHPWS